MPSPSIPTYPTTKRVADELGFASSKACARFLQDDLGLKPFPFGAGRGRGYRWRWAEVMEAMEAYRANAFKQIIPKKVIRSDDCFFHQPWSEASKQLTKSPSVK